MSNSVTVEQRGAQGTQDVGSIVKDLTAGLLILKCAGVAQIESAQLVPMDSMGPDACLSMDCGPGEPLKEAFPELASPEFVRGIQSVLHQGAPAELGEVAVRNGSHEARYLSVRAYPLGSGDVGLTVEDITRFKRSELALTESNEQLQGALADLEAAQSEFIRQERLNALGQMAVGVAHDFNNALTPILGYSELLLEIQDIQDNREKVKDWVSNIKTAAMDAAQIVNRLRDFYRREPEEETFSMIFLNEMISKVISLTQPKWKDQALSRGATVHIRKELQSLPPVPAIESELREVLINLIFNAVDAIEEEGSITLRTVLNANSVVLEVEDTGKGMKQAACEKCFEPFFSTKGARGTGLGLSVSFGIIQRHEGLIEVESEEGKGTCFRIHLPLKAKSPTKMIATDEVSKIGLSLSILIVDDDPVVARAIGELLRRDGHQVTVENDSQVALDTFRKSPFDLVITDRGMPGMNGDRLALAVKGNRPDIPVIQLTGFGEFMRAANERPEGVDVVLSKPVRLNTLRRAIIQVSKLEGFHRAEEEGTNQ